MKFLKQTMIAFAVLIGILLGFGIAQLLFKWTWPTEFGVANWIMSIALGIFCVLIVLGMLGHKFDVKKLGSYFLHFGFIVYLIGSLLYTVTGKYAVDAVPEQSHYSYTSISGFADFDLDFQYGVKDAWTEYYDPVFTIERMKGDKTEVLEENIQVGEDGYYVFGDYGRYSITTLYDNYRVESESGNTVQIIVTLANDREKDEAVVAWAPLDPSKYVAEMFFITDGKKTEKTLLVNQTIRMGGYKIYLMGLDEKTNAVILAFKKDIGEPLETTGLVMAMVGTLFHCLVYPVIKNKKFGKALPLEEKEVNGK